MTDEFEKALHRALRPQQPGADFSARVVTRLDSGETPPAQVTDLSSIRRRAFRSPWLPAALAACFIAGIGLAGIALVQVRQHALDAARANQARTQLLEALSIASDNVNIVRAAVAREENPDS
ncbi:MAG TPA: hypothetical protein VGT07_05455 [Steroidobacteraceae bacterium]|nr:hypothetical protein [Steroidobacteraceae bacterium]